MAEAETRDRSVERIAAGIADGIVDGVVDGVGRHERVIILIDGGSGSGKTELATAVVQRLGVQLVSLDDMYPGWDGLAAASALVRSDVLERSRWQRWDWAASRLAEWHDLDPDRGLVIEGCGALSASNRELATYGVWLDVPEPTRRRRALERDGDTYRPHWDRWAAQELEFFERERPDLLADLVLTDS